MRDLPLRKMPEKVILASHGWNPHFNSDACGLGHILPGSKQIDRDVRTREKSHRGEMS